MNSPIAKTRPGDSEPLDDAGALALAAGNGDRASFARLLEMKYDQIFRMAWRWCGRREEAQDIAQDVSIRLARVIPGWRGESTFDTWLHQVTLNAVRDHQRRQSRLTRLTNAFAVHAMSSEAVSVHSEDDPAEAMWQAVRELPPKQRDATLLVYGEGQSHAQAAAILNCSESTVAWHIHAARKRLRTMLGKGGGDER